MIGRGGRWHERFASGPDRRLVLAVGVEAHHANVAALGELDARNEAFFATTVEQLERRDVRSITLDLSGLTFIDSCGLRALLVVRRRIGTQLPVRFVSPSPAVQRILAVTQLESLVTLDAG